MGCHGSGTRSDLNLQLFPFSAFRAPSLDIRHHLVQVPEESEPVPRVRLVLPPEGQVFYFGIPVRRRRVQKYMNATAEGDGPMKHRR